jgi:hypothetical protein
MSIDRYKIGSIVEYIKTHSFEFECIEVEDHLQSVLNYYGFSMYELQLNEAEERLLKEELMILAEKFEFREVERIVARCEPLFAETGKDKRKEQLAIN